MMGMWHALFHRLKPGSEEHVKELLRGSGPLEAEIRDTTGKVVARIFGTMAFVGKGIAVRLITPAALGDV